MVIVQEVNSKPLEVEVDDLQSFNWVSNKHCDWLQEVPPILPDGQRSIKSTHSYKSMGFDGTNLFEKYGTHEDSSIDGVVPNSLQQSLEKNCRLTIRSKTDFGLDLKGLFPKGSFLQYWFSVDNSDSGYINFQQFITLNEISPTVPVKILDKNNDILWRFRVYYKQYSNLDEHERPYCEIVINESKGFFIHSYFYFLPVSMSNANIQNNDGETVKIETVYESVVEHYKEVAKGLYFPDRILQGFGPKIAWDNRQKEPKNFYSTEYRINKIRINEQVQDDPCFNIPEFYIVSREDIFRTLNNKEETFVPISIWGKNNEEAVTFFSQKEFDEYVKANVSSNFGTVEFTVGYFWTIRVILILSGLLSLLIAFFVSRRFTVRGE
jgi:hypothetical protein